MSGAYKETHMFSKFSNKASSFSYKGLIKELDAKNLYHFVGSQLLAMLSSGIKFLTEATLKSRHECR